MRRKLLVALLLASYALLTAYLIACTSVSTGEGYVSTSGAELRYLEWSPEAAPRGLAVLYHGYGGSAEMMSWVGIELARNGYRVVAFDNRGHGKSSSRFNVSASTLLSDLNALLSSIGYRGEPLVLVGHSMGGYAVQTIARSGVPVEAVVVVASRPLTEAPANRSLLVLAGLDEIFPPSSALRQELKGWDVRVLPADDHLTVLYDPVAVNTVLEWLIGSYVSLAWERLLATLARSAVALALMASVAYFLATGGTASHGSRSLKRCALLTAAAAPLAFPVYSLLTRVISAPVAAYVVSVLWAQAVGVLASFGRSSLGPLKSSLRLSPGVLASSLAMAAVGYFLLHEALQPFFNVEPSPHRVPLAFLLAILTIPPVLIVEALARPLLGGGYAARVAKSVSLRAASFLTAWAAAGALLGFTGFAGYLLVVTLVSLILLVPIDAAAAAWATRGSPTGNALWVSLTLSIIVAAVTPIS